MSDIPLLVYQLVRYVGPRFPCLEPGWEGIVSDANDGPNKPPHGWLLVHFPNRQAQRHECRVEWLEPI